MTATGCLCGVVPLRRMQQINMDFGIQKQVLPFDRVVDASLAQDALKLLG